MPLDKSSKQRQKILIISHDKIGTSMAGPGIRYHYMGQELSQLFDVTIGFFDQRYLPDAAFNHRYKVKHIDAYTFVPGFKDFDVVIALWLNESMINYCNENDIFMAFDLYAPVPVESLAASLFGGNEIKPENDFEYKSSLAMYRRFFENGDLFLCSNPRQLDYWVGYVFGADQVRLSTYDKRPFYDRFIIAPMGIDSRTPLQHTEQVIKGVMQGIEKTDKVLLWTGGIWGWYDGQILMRVMKRLAVKRPDIKLVFLGTKHPNPDVREMKESFDTRQLAKKLGVLNKNVFFKDGWVPYHERINYLLECDVAINTHKTSIETEFSHRTRVLDHILAELPSISTCGDYLSDEVIERKGLGLTVPPSNEAALEAAIIRILEPTEYAKTKKAISVARPSYDWQESLSMLKGFLAADPTKLQRLSSVPMRRSRKGAIGFARKVTPVFVKKIIIRGISYGD